MFCIYFLCDLPIHFLQSVLWLAEVLHFNIFQFINLTSLLLVISVLCLRTIDWPQRNPPMFVFCKDVIVIAFMFWSVIDQPFVYDVNYKYFPQIFHLSYDFIYGAYLPCNKNFNFMLCSLSILWFWVFESQLEKPP